MRLGDTGPEVTRLQLAILLHDPLALPRWGADGQLGAETWTAARALAERLRLEGMPERPALGMHVPFFVVDALLAPPADDDAPEPEGEAAADVDTGPPFPLLDLAARRVPARPKDRVIDGSPVYRDPSKITSVTLHQTDVVFGLSARQIEAAGGDRMLALARRGLGVACHQIAFRRRADAPIIVRAAPVLLWVNHGNGLNPTSLGLEIEGVYPGLVGDKRTLGSSGRAETPLDEETIEVARAALRDLTDRGRAAGCDLRYLDPHRASSAMRRRDPGEGLWRALAPWAWRELGLAIRPGLVLGTGRALPREWDPTGVVRY